MKRGNDLDFIAIVQRLYVNHLDQFTDLRDDRVASCFATADRFRKAADPRAICFSDPGMQRDHRHRILLTKAGPCRISLCGLLGERRLDVRKVSRSVGDRRHKPCDRCLGGTQPALER
ncbi:hypothetical protein [Sphingomonas sp. PP-CE-3A-406]|uniref:hypothetical protein n=1 Tax=Sphingomonas sp. PP-CE-3A-406 TaxID=2135659 RepID=UPI00217EEE97|nr:hypothetical protein [Sphingomonas sp. PP-CE-3A-406]